MKGLYKILLLVIVPLLVAFGIGSFAYNNSTGYFLSWYIDDSGYKATEEEMEKYIDFYSDAYDVYYTEEVKMFNDELNKDVKLFDLTVYRWFEVEFDDDNQLNKFYENILFPTRATTGSAGYDFYAPCDFEIKPGQQVLIPTGIRVRMEESYVLMLFPRSETRNFLQPRSREY